jgi:hypothetical protein
METTIWFKAGAKVRVAVQSACMMEGTVEAIVGNGFYLNHTRELHIEGMCDVKPPNERFIAWNLFQFADLLEPAPSA